MNKDIVALEASIACLKLLLMEAKGGAPITAQFTLDNTHIVPDPIASSRKGFDVLMDLGGQTIQVMVNRHPKTVQHRLAELYPNESNEQI